MKMPIWIDNSAPTSPSRAVIGAVTTTIACVIPVFLVGGLAVQIGEELRFDPAGLGLAVSAYFGVGALASVPSGALAERFGPRITAWAGIALSASTLAAIAFARSYPVLLVLLGVSGIANALGQLASNSTLAAHVPRRRQGLSFGLKQASIPMATLLSGLAVPTVALTVGWRWAFGLSAVLALAALVLVPREDLEVRRRNAAEPGERATGALIVMAAAALLGSGSAGALGTFLVDSAVVDGFSPGVAGLTLTAGSAACVVARVGGGWIADRLDRGHTDIIAASVTVGAMGLALIASGGTGLLIGVFLGFAFGWSWPGLQNFAVVRLHPQAPAAATAITQTGVYAGGCIGPLVFGTVAAQVGYSTAWLGAAVAMLCAGTLMFVGGRLLQRRFQTGRITAPG